MIPPSQILNINYHYCAPPEQSRPGFNGVSPSVLDRQFSSIQAWCRKIPTGMVPLSPTNFSDGTGCQISFDDGMKDVVSHALPIAKQYGFPIIIFCCALPYQEGRVLNVQKSHLLQGRWGWQGFRKKFMSALADDPEGAIREDCRHLGLDRMYRYDSVETGEFKRLLNVELPYPVVDRIMDLLFESEYGPQKEAVRELYMSPEDIQRCVNDGINIGLHSYAHRMLSRLSEDSQADDMDASLAYFRDRLSLPIDSISYPYGISGSWNDSTKRLAENRGLRAGYTLGRAIYHPVAYPDPYEIPRFDMNDVFDADGSVIVEL